MVTDSGTQLALACGDIPERDLAYLAGLFDGEGWIRARVTEPDKNGRRMSLQLGIANTDKETLGWIKDILGGGVTKMVRGKHSRWTQCYQWQVTNKLAIKRIITSLYPYLRIKKERATLLIQLVNILKQNPGFDNNGLKRKKASHSEIYWSRIKSLADAIFALNTKRGTEK